MKPKGFPITFDTGSGEEETVWAYSKPLGLEYNKELPIKILVDKDGHGRDIGIKVGWIMKAVNGRDITQYEKYEDVLHVMREEVGKLPGGVPLTFIVGGGNSTEEKTVWACRAPLGLKYHQDLPVTVSEVEDESHADELGIEVGWVLKSCNYKDVYNKANFAEVNKVLHEEMKHL